MPILSYFLIVGSVLTGLLFYADSVMVPVSLPFSTSQSIGLPEPYKAPVVVVEVPKPVIIAATVEPPLEAKGRLKKSVSISPRELSVSQYRKSGMAHIRRASSEHLVAFRRRRGEIA